MTSIERWQQIPAWEGLYEASDGGRIRSLSRPRHPGRILKPTLNVRGYYRVDLSRDGKQATRLVHQLVLLAFVGPCPDGMEVLHGPGGRTDNRLSNLSYGTHSQNCRDKRRDGTNPNGEACWQTVLTAEQVREIRSRTAGGHTYGLWRTLGKEYGVSGTTIRKIAKGLIWQGV